MPDTPAIFDDFFKKGGVTRKCQYPFSAEWGLIGPLQ